jgi:hypothetical protein
MTGLKEDQVTYPSFLQAGEENKLLFLYRNGVSGNGETCIKVYSTKVKEWQDIEPCILSGIDGKPWKSSPYLNTPVIDQKGNLHLSFVWRTDFIGSDSLVNNIGYDYVWSPDLGKTWFTSKNVPLKTPITQVNSETVFAVALGSNLINQSGMAVDSKGNPHIVFYSDDSDGVPQYQHLWFDGKTWHQAFISSQKNDFRLLGKGSLPLPMSRPEILIDTSDNVYVIYQADFTNYKLTALKLSAPDYIFQEQNTRKLWDEPVGFAEPVIDKSRWQSKQILSILVQYGSSPNFDRPGDSQIKPVNIVEWDLAKGFE